MSLSDRLHRLLPGRRAWWSLVTLAVLAGAAAAVIELGEPPDRVAAEEFDGRTWLTTDGGRLVLANGISGLVEAQASTDDDIPRGLRFAGSNRRATLLESDRQAVLVADGSHQATIV